MPNLLPLLCCDRRLLARFMPAIVLGVAGLLGGWAHAATLIQRGAFFDPPSLDPSRGTAGPAGPILSDLVEGLVSRGRRGEPVAACAERWEISEDLRTYRFHLREDLRWSDGRPLTGEDFVYSFRRLLDPATAAPGAGLFFIIEGGRAVARGERPPAALAVSAPDPRTVVIRLERPAPYFIQLLANSQGVPVPRHAIEAHGADWTRPGIMVSNGPYRLVERVPQSHLRLARNPYFFAAAEVQIDAVNWRTVQDLGAAFREFRAGELDTVLMAPPDELDWIRDNMPEALHSGPIQAVYHLVFNLDRAPYDDPRVRRALALAVDSETIADQVLRGGVRPATSLVTPGTGDYPGLSGAADPRPLAERQAEARRLLAAAGFGPERPLVVPLLFDTQEENRKIMVAVAAMWQAVGVVARLENVEGRAMLGRMRARDFDVARASLFAVYDDAYAFLQKFRSDDTDNRPGYRNPRFDAALEAANASAGPATRVARLADAEAMLLADHPVIPIYWYVSKVLVGPRVQGWVDAPLGTPPTRYLWLR